MNISAFLDQVFFTIGNKEFTYLNILTGTLTVLFFFGLYLLIVRKVLPRVFGKTPAHLKNQRRVTQIIRIIFLLGLLIGLLWTLNLDYIFHETTRITISISTILQALLIIQFAQLLDWFFSKFLIYNYEKSRENVVNDESSPRKIFSEKKISRKVQYAMYVLAIILILQNFDDQILLRLGSFELRLSNIFIVIFIIVVSQLLAWIITQLVLFSYFRKSEVNIGGQYAINQIVKYIIYVLAFFISAQALGLQMTVLLGGLAALLVGVGLGLQQTFNDLFSGIILLFERSVEIGQMIEVDGLIGSVKQIGLRTSIVETRDNVTVIVPNSKLITEKVINWSHYDDKVRFHLSVGVAYGSDTALVKEVLLQVAKENVYVLDFPISIVRFKNFGDSSLDFELHFWSRNFMVIEDIKSDIRLEIDQAFREKGIQIPFPQRDVWMRGK
ncbi:MAG: small-conductance mechanosensitive channel [Saprospiraceae bacterium]|jgi:small-conductance mechanosensitive channel